MWCDGLALRSLEDDIVVVLDRASGQLLGYDNDREEDFVAMDIKAFKERQGSSIGFRYDLVDCFIDICDPDVRDGSDTFSCVSCFVCSGFKII